MKLVSIEPSLCGATTMADNLTQVVRYALADLIAMYYEGNLSIAAKKTITELFEALKENGEEVTEYETDYANVLDDLNEK